MKELYTQKTGKIFKGDRTAAFSYVLNKFLNNNMAILKPPRVMTT